MLMWLANRIDAVTVSDNYTCSTCDYHGQLGLSRWKRTGCLICPSCAAVGKELSARKFRAIEKVDSRRDPAAFAVLLSSVDEAVKEQGCSPFT